MDVNEFIPFLIKAREVETDEHLRAQWISMLPLMSTKQLKYISFEDYRDQCLGRNIDKRSTDEIIAELEKIHGHKLL